MNINKLFPTSLFIYVLLIFSSGLAYAAQDSGFLDNYSNLTADPDRAGAKIYRKQGVSLGKYNKIAIEPVEIWYAPDTAYKGISPDELKVLADSFRGILVNELEPDYPVVSSAGDDVLHVRLAISNLKMKKKKRGLLGYMPIGMAVTAVADMAGKRIIMSDATIEAELLDSKTGERIGALVDELSESVSKDQEPSWQTLEQALTFYAKRFRSRLDAEH